MHIPVISKMLVSRRAGFQPVHASFREAKMPEEKSGIYLMWQTPITVYTGRGNEWKCA
jgi:hypothetical protein